MKLIIFISFLFFNITLHAQIELYVHQQKCETKTAVSISNYPEYTPEQIDDNTLRWIIDTPNEPQEHVFFIDTVGIMFERFWITPETKRIDFHLENCHAYRFWVENPNMLTQLGRANQYCMKGILEKTRTKEEYWDLRNEYLIDFIKKNPTSYLSIYYLVGMELERNEKKALLSLLAPFFKESKLYRKVERSLIYNGNSDIGQALPSAPLFNLEGGEFSFDELKGDGFVLFFWMSGCGPCLRLFPEVVALQEKYKNKDIHFVYYSLDENKKLWETTLKEKQHINSKYHISELEEWSGILPLSLHVKGTPYFVIVNKEHKIQQFVFGSELFLVDEELEKMIDGKSKD